LLVHNTPYKTCQILLFNVIIIESYKDVPKEDNYFLGTLLPYLKLFHYFGFSVPTFVENCPFGATKSLKEDDVKFQTLFEKCTRAYNINFYRNSLISIVSNPNYPFFVFLKKKILIFLFLNLYSTSIFGVFQLLFTCFF
jgi:hypothetical protein